ncbi:EVE domain-containing protein [Candidatus Parcubacteria bacterium]|uniref:EVE domain-containing protein n=1 Tax=Candidatus Kaiserbacteria bacterium CG10_big_fil_rev_8_21_14_0_10_47_16 TaxID=1974608 RepID=A0A2H0UD35_9BACT|nr:EVE domain-containing protein [Candidatus Parcubacteria bacterium]PIR84260.1 MAG: EVE domain-containing protein [Candidatus Kaiserbacteria bacterium CG10_big_fil_rev_8_21_14_0_10_47_16]
MKYWLLKSEPKSYSIDDLKRDKQTLWDGVRNYQARNLIRDTIEKGDLVLFYHSNTEPIGVFGIAEVVSDAYPDPTQFDPKDHHFDKTAKRDNPRWYVVDVKFKEKFKHPITLAEIKNDPAFTGMPLIQKGQRLSVQPVSKKHFDHILNIAK